MEEHPSFHVVALGTPLLDVSVDVADSVLQR